MAEKPIESTLSEAILEAAGKLEQQLDERLQELEDIGQVREKRLKELKEMASHQAEWKSLGHGEYEELSDEKQFFATTKKSQNTICHFFKDEVFVCKLVDHHLNILTQRHLEAKFCKINGSRCRFLVEKLAVKSFPTIICVVDSMVKHRISTFTGMKQRDDYCTALLEWHIAQSGAISYKGDLKSPPEIGPFKKNLRDKARQKYYDEDSDDSDD